MDHRAAKPQPKERGCVRRGPAAAAPKPRRPRVESETSPAANPLRLVLRAHSRAPRIVLAAREDFAAAPAPTDEQRIVVSALLLVPEGSRRKLAGGKPAQRARPPVAPPNGPGPSGASKKFLASSSPQHLRHHHHSPGPFSSMPRWGTEPLSTVSEGRRPLVRTCPRLISSGVPPGREAGVPTHSTYAVRRLSEYSAAPVPPQPLRLRLRHSVLQLCKTLARSRGFFPERGGVRGAPAAAGWPHGTPSNLAGASELSGPLRLVRGVHSRAPPVADLPRRLHPCPSVSIRGFPIPTSEFRCPQSCGTDHSPTPSPPPVSPTGSSPSATSPPRE